MWKHIAVIHQKSNLKSIKWIILTEKKLTSSPLESTYPGIDVFLRGSYGCYTTKLCNYIIYTVVSIIKGHPWNLENVVLYNTALKERSNGAQIHI